MFIFMYNPVTNEVTVTDRKEDNVAWFAVTVPQCIYFFADIAPLEE